MRRSLRSLELAELLLDLRPRRRSFRIRRAGQHLAKRTECLTLEPDALCRRPQRFSHHTRSAEAEWAGLIRYRWGSWTRRLITPIGIAKKRPNRRPIADAAGRLVAMGQLPVVTDWPRRMCPVRRLLGRAVSSRSRRGCIGPSVSSLPRSRRVLSQVAGYWAGQAMGRQVVKGANAQQFREAETITVEFEPERRKLEDDETAPT